MDPRRTRTWLSAALALTLVASGCGDNSDDEPEAETGAGTTAKAPGATGAAGGKTLAVTGTDYAFGGVPATVPAGTVVSFKNESDKEVHELVALRIKDGDTRPLSGILTLPDAERDAAAEFRGVLFAFPGEEGMAPAGPVTLAQPGRWVFVCSIPTGADPAAYRNAPQGPGAPEVPGGPPHAVQGMVTELQVT